MAAIGNVGTFATTQPIQGDPIGRAMGIVEQNAFKYREEEDAKAKEAQKAEQARLKEIEDLKIDTDFKASGVPLVDSGIYKAGLTARDDVAKMQMQMIENPNMSMAEKAGIKQRIQSYDQMFKFAKQFPEMLTKKITDIKDGVAKGNYYKGDEQKLLKELKQLETENYDLLLDKNNQPTLVIYDVNEKGEKIGVLKKTPLGSYINELTPRKNFEYDKSINTFTEKIKPMVTATQTGINITKKEQLTPAIVNSVNSHVKYLLDDPNTSSILQEENPNLSPEQLKQKITDDIYARILTKDERSIDTSRERLYYDKTKDKEEKQVVVGTPSEIIKQGDKDGVTLQKGTKSYPLNNAVIKGTGGKEQRATNVYVSPGGKMYLRVENSGSEGASKKVTRYTEKGLRRQKEALANKVAYEPEFDDIEDVTITDKAAEVEMLDFGKDGSKIGEIATYMGYSGPDEMADDFIARSGFDIKAKPSTQKANTTKTRVYKGIDNNGNPIFE
jgi:hypothetical protein